MIVLDASAVLELLLGMPGAPLVARRIAPAEETLHAPQLIDLEVAQVLRRYTLSGEVDEARAAIALDDFCALALERYAHQPMLGRIWQLRANATAYDASYLALAEVLRAPLVTFDTKLARTSGHRARVEVLGSRKR